MCVLIRRSKTIEIQASVSISLKFKENIAMPFIKQNSMYFYVNLNRYKTTAMYESIMKKNY